MNEQLEKLLGARAFYFVKALGMSYSKGSQGYTMVVDFQVTADTLSHRKLKFFIKDSRSAYESIKAILECDKSFNPSDEELMALWQLYLEDFKAEPQKGLSLYRPDFKR